MLHDNYWDDFAARRSRRSVLRGGMITAAGLTSGAVLAGCSTGSPAVPTVAPALAPAAAPTVAAVGTAAPVTVRPKYGGTFITAEMAQLYGVTDTDGRVIPSLRAERGHPIWQPIRAHGYGNGR